MFEIASRKVPSLKDGNVDRAKDILQTAPWSQTAFYRDKDADKPMCKQKNVFSDAQTSSKGGAIRALLNALGVKDYYLVAHLQLQRLPARSAVFGRLSRRGAMGAG